MFLAKIYTHRVRRNSLLLPWIHHGDQETWKVEAMLNLKKRVGVASLVFGFAGGVVGLAGSSPVLAGPQKGDEKVTICHATGSETNPYVTITVSVNSLKNGHSGHTGPVWFPGAKARGVTWGDIIPPNSVLTSGQNWTKDGKAICLNRCQPPKKK